MKKLYTLLSVTIFIASAITFISPSAHAQIKLNPVQVSHFTPANSSSGYSTGKDAALKKKLPHSSNIRGTSESYWLNYAMAEDILQTGGAGVLYSDYLFPDSNVVMCDENGCRNPDVFYIGEVLDPYASDLQQQYQYNWPVTTNYTVDSIAFSYLYQRQNPDTTIIDTLVVYLLDDAVSNDMPVINYPGSWGINFNIDTLADTLQAEDFRYDYITNKPIASAGAIKVIKVPLTASDTSFTYYGLKTFSTNSFPVPAGKHFGTVFGFIPGYTYYPFETITTDQNDFQFVSDDVDGFNWPFYNPGDRNVSSILPVTVRYNDDTTGYDSLFVPTYTYEAGYPFQYHEISYLVSAQNVGIHESVTYNGLKLYQNQPNPANQTTIIKYENQTPGDVSLEVHDITGRIVKELYQGMQAAGRHFISVDVSGLSKGMYLYTLKINNESLTQRMIVSE